MIKSFRKFFSTIFKRPITFKKYKWDHIVIHHSLTKDGKTVSWGAIRKYHMDNMKWDYIGYHFGVEKVGYHYEVFMGRPLNMHGAHCPQKDMNRRGIGICLVGNYDDVEPSKQALEMLALVTKAMMQMFDIPIENVKGHHDFASYKSCPGTKFNMDKFKKEYLQ